MKRKWLAIVLGGCMLAGLVGCGNAPQQPVNTSNTEAVVTETPQVQEITETPEEQVDMEAAYASLVKILNGVDEIGAGSAGCSIRAEELAPDFIIFCSHYGSLSVDEIGEMAIEWLNAKAQAANKKVLSENFELLVETTSAMDPTLDAQETYINVLGGIRSAIDTLIDAPEPESALGMIQTMCANADLWYVPQTDDSILIRYMVTDLDENGRLELVRAEYNTETMFERNRFYEITEDFTGIEKMYFQLEDYFYNGEEDGFAPDLIFWDTEVTCYRCAQFGIALDDYTGPSYFYIVSDKSEYEDYNGELAGKELYMDLHVDNSGRVTVWTYGEIITRSDGSVEYCDQEGLDCDEEGFWRDISYGHDPEYGWDEDRVHWEFVEIADVKDAPDLLLSSWDGFTRERIVTAIESEEE